MNKIEVCDVLLKYGADINYFGDKLQNCLFLAIQRDKPKMVEYLMKKGADHRIVFNSIPEMTVSETVRKVLKDNLAWRDRRGLLWLMDYPNLLARTGLLTAKKQLLLEVVKFL